MRGSGVIILVCGSLCCVASQVSYICVAQQIWVDSTINGLTMHIQLTKMLTEMKKGPWKRPSLIASKCWWRGCHLAYRSEILPYRRQTDLSTVRGKVVVRSRGYREGMCRQGIPQSMGCNDEGVCALLQGRQRDIHCTCVQASGEMSEIYGEGVKHVRRRPTGSVPGSHTRLCIVLFRRGLVWP